MHDPRRALRYILHRDLPLQKVAMLGFLLEDMPHSPLHDRVLLIGHRRMGEMSPADGGQAYTSVHFICFSGFSNIELFMLFD